MEQLAIAQLNRSVWYVVSMQRHVVSVVEQDVVLENCCSQLTYLLFLEGAAVCNTEREVLEHTAH